MKIRFAAIIGMILMMTTASLPVQAAESGAAARGFRSMHSRAVRVESAYSRNDLSHLRNGWHYRDGNWFYVKNGKAVTGWVKYIGKWYYLDRDGKMKTGWLKDNGKWYYLDRDGKMKTGWLKDDGKWYYLASNGAMKTGWVKDRGKWYYLSSNGIMKTGWLKIGGKTYYLTAGGVRKTGWLKIKGKKYYFDGNGVLNAEKTREANEPADSLTKTSSTSTQTSSTSTQTSSRNTGTSAKAAQTGTSKTKGEMIAEYALQFVGNPYVYGGCSLTEGTDCSGFVMLIYRHFGVSLPHYDAAIRTMGKEVGSLAEAKAGDVICYYGHVAIYLGDGRIVHASNSRDGIKISERADYRTIAGIRRFFD